MLLGFATPWPASAEPPSGGGEEPRPVLAEQRVRGDARRRGSRGQLGDRLRPRAGDDDDVELPGIERGKRDRDLRRDVLEADVLMALGAGGSRVFREAARRMAYAWVSSPG